MKRRASVALGLILILVGGAMLADRLGYLAGREALAWTLVFGALGILFLVLLTAGARYRWAVWPACLFLSLSALLYVTANGLLPDDVAAGGFIFFGIALPFWLALFFGGRAFWWATIPAGILTFIAAGTALAPWLGENWTGALILWGVAFPFWIVYLVRREQWWALIPAGILTTVGFVPLVAPGWPGWAPITLLFGGVGGTFLLVYLLSGLRRERSWALWPALVCVLLAALAPLAGPWYRLLGPVVLLGGGLALLVVALIRQRAG